MPQSVGSQRVRHDLVTEQQQQQATLCVLFVPVSNPLEVGFQLILIYK